MIMKQDLFWEKKSLKKMTLNEWESLCDGCGKCCLEKIEDEKTGAIKTTSITCEYLDIKDCRCIIYEDRHTLNSDCVQLSPRNIRNIKWLPETCAYRRLDEGKKLEWWHPLISGDSKSVHNVGISICNQCVPGKYVRPEDIRTLL